MSSFRVAAQAAARQKALDLQIEDLLAVKPEELSESLRNAVSVQLNNLEMQSAPEIKPVARAIRLGLRDHSPSWLRDFVTNSLNGSWVTADGGIPPAFISAVELIQSGRVQRRVSSQLSLSGSREAPKKKDDRQVAKAVIAFLSACLTGMQQGLVESQRILDEDS